MSNMRLNNDKKIKTLMRVFFSMTIVISSPLFSEQSQAQIGVQYGGQFSGSAGLYGSGYYGGVQPCRSGWNTNSQFKTKEDKKIAKLDKKIAKLEREQERAESDVEKGESKLERIKERLERSLNSTIVEFLTETHIGGKKNCVDYETSPLIQCNVTSDGGTTGATQTTAGGSATPVDQPEVPSGCSRKVPDLLKPFWTTDRTSGLGYCLANGAPGNAGLVDANKICSQEKLRAEDRKASAFKLNDCVKYLNDYRTEFAKLDAARDKLTALNDALENADDDREDLEEDREYALENRRNRRTEAYCEDCNRYESNRSNLLSSAAQIGLGLGLGFLGKRYDDRNAKYSAQLGFPPEAGYPTAVALGAPLVLGGIYGAINGNSGGGGFGCASGLGGVGFPYGANGALYGSPFGGAAGPYGPFAGAGGAFGYPQGLFGNPWGGGAYLPGFNPYGGLNGPNFGGFPGAFPGGYPGLGVAGAIGGAVGFQVPGFQGLGFQIPGFQGAGYPGLGIAGAIGGAVGFQVPGFQGIGFQVPGLQVPGFQGIGIAGAIGGLPGFQVPGFQVPGFQGIGIAGAIGGAVGFQVPGFQGLGFQGLQDPRYQQQILQIQQQQAQIQAQYYQAQIQQQQAQFQRQIQITQQASQVQQEIASLQVKLQLLYSGAYVGTGVGGVGTGGGYIGGGSIGTAAPSVGIGGAFLGGASAGYGANINTPPPFIPVNSGTFQNIPGQQFNQFQPTFPGTGANVTVPGTGNGR